MSWTPSAPLRNLRLRARVLAQVRTFFALREVQEVETPLLANACVPDPMIESFPVEYHGPGGERTLYLQSSPELHMKRLLAAGSGPIYQICRVFRNGEAGRLHNPEFTLLEWYRPGYDHHRLMDEVDALLQSVLDSVVGERLRYAEVFALESGIDDPVHAPLGELQECAAQWCAEAGTLERDDCLHLIFSHLIEPLLGRGCPTFVYDYPASQAALARRCPDNPDYAERFEVYVEGMELANGFHELTDAAEQRRRFAADLETRRRRGQPVTPLDEHFLTALDAGLPPCAGVALGFDRLLMLLAGAMEIAEVLAFPLARA